MRDIKIIQAENGFILESEYELSDGTTVMAREIFEDGDNELKSIRRMFLNIAERIYPYDAFSKSNINVIVKFNRKGDEFCED